MTSKFYSFSAESLDGKIISMDAYRGKVILVVNTASKCGFTPQYTGLEALHQKYSDSGLAILGFPCNQFGNQEPGTEKEIAEGCLLNYGVTFQMFSKVDVNGNNAHPIYEYLKNERRGSLGKKIRWNFTKFLIDRQGNPIKRIASPTVPSKIEPTIIKLLGDINSD